MDVAQDDLPDFDVCQDCAWAWPRHPHCPRATCPSCANPTATQQPQDICGALQLLPAKCPFHTALWLPRATRNYAAVTLTWLLSEAAEQLNREDHDAKKAQLLLYLFPALTMREAAQANRPNGPDSRAASTQANHNRRLSKAAKGEWEELIREYVADLIAADPRVKPPDHPNQPSQVAEDDQPLDQTTLERAARRAREGAVTAAATTLTGGPRVQPSREAAAQITAQFITTPTRPEDDNSAQRVMQRIKTRASPETVIGKCLVLEFIARLKPLAGTGPSGWRSSYIAAIANHRDAKLTGIESVTRWTNAWANGRASRWATDLWTRSLARPFYKENRRAIRPIICAEHLYKLAGGLIFRGARQELIRACGPRQYGYSRPGGAPREAAEIQAAINCNPGWPILTVDVKNAFGSVAWTAAAEIMQQKAPSTATFLATQWQNGQTTLLIEENREFGRVGRSQAACYKEVMTATRHFASRYGTTSNGAWDPY